MTSSNFAKRQAGFSLIELMITVAIVGILAMVALPAYQDYILRSKIVDATSKLGDYRAKMEKYYLDWRRYDSGGACGVPAPAVVANSDYFSLGCVATATTYTVTATGIPARGMSNLFIYSVDQTNTKQSQGPSGWVSSTTCWAIRKDGTC